jgi:hypothetical protein
MSSPPSVDLLLTVFNGRDSTIDITVRYQDGAVVVPEAGDYVRIKIGKEQNVPILDFVGGTPTANGSSFPANTNPFTLILKRADISLLNRGIWNLEVSFWENEAAHFYWAQEFILEVRGNQTGAV